MLQLVQVESLPAYPAIEYLPFVLAYRHLIGDKNGLRREVCCFKLDV